MVMPRTTPNPRSGMRGISEQDVWEAADALLLAGQRPTIERIRLQMGRGSPNTVSPYLDAWFAGLGARLRQPQGFAGASGGTVPETVAQAAAHLWDVALTAGKAEVAEMAAARTSELDAQAQALAAEREALVQARAVLQERLASAEVAAADARQARDEAQAQARRAEAQWVTAQADAVESRRLLALARQEKEALQAERDAERAAWDEERQRVNARADASERRLMLELDGQREANKAMIAAQKTLQKDVTAAEGTIAALRETQLGLEAARTVQEAVTGRLREQLSAQELLVAQYRALIAAPRESISSMTAAGGRRLRPSAAAAIAVAPGARRGRR
ncbi:Chromosome partition protein Smc [Pandoraea terrae]|uniref:Chromosome partition protein Smc n=1 Tax=Pandoraea terrae TaxID=1537710 RepID=A0A5E4SEG3_9BURK|nr:DNA-binding protein [Pandoraea terrae]VVD72449.1 Chromosome partition protein Smc [Pandoraea terrae]